MKKKVEVMVTAFRDGFQSCVGARVFTDDFYQHSKQPQMLVLHILKQVVVLDIKFPISIVVKNAFDMMDRFRSTVGPDAKIYKLSARGVNVVGLDSQSSDIIDLHAKMFKSMDDNHSKF